MKILIVKLSAIGDVVHCLPVAAAIKKALPGAHLAWLVDKGSAELLLNNPCVDEVITFEGKRWSKDAKNPVNWLRVGGDFSKFISELKARNFDVALEMQGLFKSGFIALASGAKVRMGFDGTREFAESFLTHKVNVGDYFGHDVPVVELNLKIVEALLRLLGEAPMTGRPVFQLPATTGETWQKIDGLLGGTDAPSYMGRVAGVSGGLPPGSDDMEKSTPALSSGKISMSPKPEMVSDAPSIPPAMPSVSDSGTRKLCVLIPGTTWVTKIWPEEQWYQLGLRLLENGYRLLIIGAKSEVEANKRLTDRLNARQSSAATDLTSQTSLLDLAALFKVSDLVVGGDTGPLHLAAAVGTVRVVGIYGSTPWRRNGPYGRLSRSVSLQLACQPCYSKQCKIQTLDCLRTLTVEQVMVSVAEVLAITIDGEVAVDVNSPGNSAGSEKHERPVAGLQ